MILHAACHTAMLLIGKHSSGTWIFKKMALSNKDERSHYCSENSFSVKLLTAVLGSSSFKNKETTNLTTFFSVESLIHCSESEFSEPVFTKMLYLSSDSFVKSFYSELVLPLTTLCLI